MNRVTATSPASPLFNRLRAVTLSAVSPQSTSQSVLRLQPPASADVFHTASGVYFGKGIPNRGTEVSTSSKPSRINPDWKDSKALSLGAVGVALSSVLLASTVLSGGVGLNPWVPGVIGGILGLKSLYLVWAGLSNTPTMKNAPVDD